jgi:glycosyltransferase involved in cell wall biosynthesis
MHILMISDVYFPRINGVSTSIATFRRELAALGHEVSLIAPEYPAPTPADPRILRIPSRYLAFDPEDRIMRARRIKALLPVLRAESFDLVHIQTPFVAHYLGLWLARRLGLPAVESYHTFFEEYLYHYFPLFPRGLMRRIARGFSRRQCNSVDGVVVPSRPMFEVLRRYGVSTREEIIPTGLETEAFVGGDGAAFRARLGIAPERPTLVHVGRIAHEKNIDFLLQVAARVRRERPDLALVIAGEGPALAHLKRMAETLELSRTVYFVGYLDRATELLDCYRAGDAFVFSSRTETQGLVLLEAMALGVPVVSTAFMGTRDILEPRQGALVAEEDVEDFSAQVLHLLGDEALRARLAAEAVAYARSWSAPALAGRLAGFYAEVVGNAASEARSQPA